jgi:hypothetical protein
VIGDVMRDEKLQGVALAVFMFVCNLFVFVREIYSYNLASIPLWKMIIFPVAMVASGYLSWLMIKAFRQA